MFEGSTATFLLTDIEGSTQLWEREGDRMVSIVARHVEIIDEVVRRYGGIRPVEQGEGDSTVSVFDQASMAFSAAVEAQRALLGEGWAGGVDLRVRMAIHTGESRQRSPGFFVGRPLNRCARIRATAFGGQIVVSSAAVDAAAGALPDGIVLQDLGMHRLRDLAAAEQIWQVNGPDLPSEFPPLRSLDSVPNNLPMQLSTFVGRLAEVAQLEGLSDRRLVTLTGAGGSGKTRLALQAAAEQAPAVSSAWFVDLSSLSDGNDIAAHVASVLGVREVNDVDTLDLVVGRLADHDTLLVLDNCEHLIVEAGELVGKLLAGATRLRILATSREPLGLAGEVVLRVPSMRVPDRSDPDAESADAVRLFVERATEVAAGYVPNEAELASIITICERLDGIPLAIELAAARIRMMTAPAIAEALADRFRLLTRTTRGGLARQQTLRASIDWSYSLLTRPEQVVLDRLSTFVGPFTLEAAEAVGAGDDLDRYELLDIATSLIDKSLLIVEPGTPVTTHRLLESVRQYAEERLLDADGMQGARDAHLAHYRHLCQQAGPELEGGGQGHWVAALAAEFGNIDAAHAWAVEEGADDPDAAEAAWAMAGSLTFFFSTVGRFGDARRWFAGCESLPAAEPAIELAARWGATYLAFYAGDFARGLEIGVAGLELAHTAGDLRHEARLKSALGTLSYFSDLAGCEDELRAAVGLARQAHDDWCVTDATQLIAYTLLARSRITEGLARLDEVLPIVRRLGLPTLLCWDMLGRGWADLSRGRLTSATARLTELVNALGTAGDPNIVGQAHGWRAMSTAHGGDLVAASAEIDLAMGAALSAGATTAVVTLVIAGAVVIALEGDLEQLDEYVGAWEPTFDGQAPLASGLLATLAGLTAARSGATERARRELSTPEGASISGAQQVQRGSAMAYCLAVDNEPVKAASMAWNAAETADRLDLGIELADALRVLATAEATTGDDERAMRIWGATDSIDAELGLVICYLPCRDERVAAHQRLGARSDELAATGRAMGRRELMAWLARGRGERNRPSSGWDSLTPTEATVVDFVVQGLTNRLIGEKMFISADTVKTHLAHIYDKLGVRTRTEVAARSARHHP